MRFVREKEKTQKIEIVKMEAEDKVVGQDFVIRINVKNKVDETLHVTVNATLHHVHYTGIKKGSIKRQQFKSVQFGPKEGKITL